MKYWNGKIPIFVWALVLGLFLGAAAQQKPAGPVSSLAMLLPQLSGWTLADEPRPFRPDTLFEYINGAAEVYLSYDFQELLVAEFQGKSTKASLTVEIYDMGDGRNAFGIYSAERYPESRFLAVGNQGYLDEGSLNFLIGRYYIKLLCFEAGTRAEEFLRLFARDLTSKVKDHGSLPAQLAVFPREGLISNSEKFVLRNFLGFKFLANGFSASYRIGELEFDCFFIEAKSEEEAGSELKQILDYFAKSGRSVEKQAYGIRIKDSYLKNIFLAQAGKYVCGVSKINDGSEGIGQKYLEAVVSVLKGK